MTEPQQATINRLRERGYSVRVMKYVRGRILLAMIKRRLARGYMPLRINPDGTYECPWYDTRNHNRWRDQAWQS